MKEYPSIQDSSSIQQAPCYASLKLDGSNFRVEWSPKKGFRKFGLRHRLLGADEPIFGQAIPIFLNKFEVPLTKILRHEKVFRGAEVLTIFGEFYGEDSFAGQHKPNKQYNVTLFDVNIHKKGFLSCKDFYKIFDGFDIVPLIYIGNLNKEFVESIKSGKINLETTNPIKTRIPEGVVAKVGTGHELKMFKIKTDAYREELKRVYADSWQSFWE